MSAQTDRFRKRPEPERARLLARLSAEPLLTAEQEQQLGREFADRERAYWQAMLAEPQAVEDLLAVMEVSSVEAPASLRTLRKQMRGWVGGKPDAKQRASFRKQSTLVAAELRDLDVQRELAQRCHDAWCAATPRRRGLSKVRAARAAQLAVKNHFVAANVRLVIALSQRYGDRRLPLEDLIQEGTLGLIKAVERFDPARGLRFSTYAAWWIRHAVTRALADKGRLVRVPVHAQEGANRVRRATSSFTARHGRGPSESELANEAELPLERIQWLARTPVGGAPVSLDQPLSSDNPDTWGDRLTDQESVGAEEHLATVQQEALAEDLLGTLSPMEADVLRRRFGLGSGEEHTLREIGATYNLSRERIRQIQHEALGKLRDHMRKAG